MTNLPPPEYDDIFDPALEAIAGVILDGGPINLESATSSASVDAFASELRVVAGVAALHRSLSDDEADPARFPPEFPWRVGTHLMTASLGRGTYGEVFRAWDDQLHRDVAIKLLFAGHNRGDVAARALDEGRLLARVRHPNVVAVHGVERIDGRVGLVTEFIEGHTLAEAIRESGPLGHAEGARIGVDLTHALHAVHEAGLLHRDVKAQNVMRDRNGRVVLMDFGAGLTHDTGPALAGTPLYLAPEVLSGGPATRQSDIYGAGVLLHYLLTAGYPVAGASLDDIRAAHRARARVTLRNARPDMPRALAEAIDRATEPEPSRRYATAGGMARAIEAAARPHRVTRRAAAWVAAVAVTLAGAALWLAFKPRPVPAAHVASQVASRVTLPPHYDFGNVSFDGRYLAYVDPKQSAWVMQIATGHTRRVAEGGTPQGHADSLILSSDGTKGALAWRLPDNSSELRVADLDDRWPQGALAAPAPATLLHTDPNDALIPLQWSRDGSRLLLLNYRADGRVQLTTIGTSGGEPRVLHTFVAGPPRRAALSGNGRFVVYDQASALPSPQRDLFIVPADGSAPPALLLGDSANDELPVWSADDGAVLFVSDREGMNGIWRVPMRGGAAAGRPRVAARSEWSLTPAGATAHGDYYYALQTRRDELLTVALDTRGVATGPAQPVPGPAGATRRSPAWSPDGRLLAFATVRGMNMFDHGSSLTFMDRSGHVVREVAPQMRYFGVAPIRWSHDGRDLLVRGKGLDGYFGFYRVDPVTGAANAIVRGIPRNSEGGLGAAGTWGSGGRTVISAGATGVIERALRPATERVIIAAEPGASVIGLGLSRVGDRLAFTKVSGAGADAYTALAVREPSGAITELLRAPGAASLQFAEWTPDGKQILYGVGDPSRSWRIWRIDANGGAPIDMNITLESGRPRVSPHPDGRSLTYSTGRTTFEVWVMRGIAR